MSDKMRIMHGLSEVAGQNAFSVLGLKELGEDAQSVLFYRHPFDYPFDKSLGIDRSKKSKLPLYAVKLVGFLVYALVRFNVFHFHFGHSILNCNELDIYRLFRKKIFFEFHGSDLRDQEIFCKKTGIPFEQSEATSPKIHRRNLNICKKATGVIIHDDELFPYLPKQRCPVYVVPLRVDIANFTPVYPKNTNELIRIVHAPSKRKSKGTEYVLKALQELKKKYDNIEFVLVEGKTQKEAREIYKTADIIVDQLHIGTYGVFAIEGMALGKPVITYINEMMKERLPSDLPIVSAGADTIKEVLEQLILNPELRVKKGIAGRKYVENYHDYRIVAKILKAIYSGTAKPLSGRQAFDQVKEEKMKSTLQ